MSEPINDGGPAFPCQSLDPQGNPRNAACEGMSLRDYAEIQFISALISSPRALISANKDGVTPEDYINAGKLVAKVWLAERSKRK